MAHRYRLCPYAAQEAVLLEHCAHARFVWNLAVEQQSWWRPGRGSAPSPAARMRQLAQARAAEPWLAQGSSSVQQQALRDFDKAMAAFFATRTGQKAAASGAAVIYVDPRYSSQQCRQCGHVASESRESQAVFRCVACGHDDHADANAAKNVLARGLAWLAVPAQAPGPRGVRPRKTPASPGAAGTTRDAA
jgi:transposase